MIGSVVFSTGQKENASYERGFFYPGEKNHLATKKTTSTRGLMIIYFSGKWKNSPLGLQIGQVVFWSQVVFLPGQRKPLRPGGVNYLFSRQVVVTPGRGGAQSDLKMIEILINPCENHAFLT